ncbi:MAG TPA: NADP-dependent oxidoreductase [Streptosporangiaceae bacterium]|nr:NADP-dependent oxidoreductase [Streptosporangiaceae bacterium]
MQAIMVSEPGVPEVLTAGETQIPQPGPDEVLVRVKAAGVGPWDVHMASGGWTGDFPYIPGAEFSGEVVGDTGASAAFEDGEPVYGYPGLSGCYAQYVTCPAEQLAPIPTGLGWVTAAAAPVDALTAQQGLEDVLRVGSGDTVLITGAAGGLGHFAVQIARALGAIVIATASEQNHEFVHKLGAAIVVDHMQADWPDRVRELTDGGAGHVLACAAPTLAGAARAARDGAVVATPVHAGGYPDGDRVRWQQYDGRPRGSGLIAMAPWFDDGTLMVHISKMFHWKDAASAHRAVGLGHTRGKIALIVDEDLAAQLEV